MSLRETESQAIKEALSNCVGVVYVGSQVRHSLELTGAAQCEGASLSAMKISGDASGTARASPEWSDRKVYFRI